MFTSSFLGGVARFLTWSFLIEAFDINLSEDNEWKSNSEPWWTEQGLGVVAGMAWQMGKENLMSYSRTRTGDRKWMALEKGEPRRKKNLEERGKSGENLEAPGTRINTLSLQETSTSPLSSSHSSPLVSDSHVMQTLLL